jgi:HEAT repeat protein
MVIETLVLTAIADAAIGYLTESGMEKVSEKFLSDSKKRAFGRALSVAIAKLEAEHPEWVLALFDANFFSKEGAPVIAQFLIRDGKPDASELAKLWADSMGLKGEKRTARVRELEPAAADFLQNLAQALKTEPELSELYDSRAFERIAESAEAIHRALGTEKATPGTRYDYLRWLIDRNLYLDPRGISQTQRQVQLRLDTVYVSLRAQREDTPGVVDKRILEKEMAELESQIGNAVVSAEEVEDRREQLLALFQRRHVGPLGGDINETVELHEVVNRHERLVILGDPGSGKTTLLRYLALMHAQALYTGRAETSADLGPARFPILIRIAAYAENGIWKEKSLSDFLAEYYAAHECSKAGLADLLAGELSQGNCLVLLDGLDEIVSADDRRGIVQKIEEFVRRHDKVSNRFIITSRIAGYRNAPLAEPFVHYTVQDMNEEQIRRFLERWCPAVEDAQTPEKSPEARAETARQEMEGILKAVKTSPGVRRLAANPLLLTILALIHRTGASLPEKRIQLYKLAAETLARTWRTTQGVPESALVEETYLTRLLSKLAYWLHINKPTGIATEREVFSVLGEEWARLKRLEWNEDEQDPAIISEIEKFLTAVRVHTGLFVERAPKRYGFMHLTFEEYYVARYLVAHSRKAPGLIRQHLHNPRWEEPILLALGFKGLDYPDEAGELLETAILAQGEEAEELNFKPGEYENLLGRDYLFALRCLADQIPTDPQLVNSLINRMVEELLHQSGHAKFRRYHQALEERLASFKGSDTGALIASALKPALSKADSDARNKAFGYLLTLGEVSQEIMLSILHDENNLIRIKALESLIGAEQQTPEIVEALTILLGDKDASVRTYAARNLVQLKRQSTDSGNILRTLFSDENANIRSEAVWSLEWSEQPSLEIIALLKDLLNDENNNIAVAYKLGEVKQKTPEVIKLLKTLCNHKERNVRYWMVGGLADTEQKTPEVLDLLKDLLRDEDADVRSEATWSIGGLEQKTPEIIELLKNLLRDENKSVRFAAAHGLGQLDYKAPGIIELLKDLLQDEDEDVRSIVVRSIVQVQLQSTNLVEALKLLIRDEDKNIRFAAAQSLEKLEQRTPEIVELMKDLLREEDEDVRGMAALKLLTFGETTTEVQSIIVNYSRSAKNGHNRQQCALALGKISQADEVTVDILIRGLCDDMPDVRNAYVKALAELGRRFPANSKSIAEKLIRATTDPAFAFIHGSGYAGRDHAFDALWLLVVGDTKSGSDDEK